MINVFFGYEAWTNVRIACSPMANSMVQVKLPRLRESMRDDSPECSIFETNVIGDGQDIASQVWRPVAESPRLYRFLPCRVANPGADWL